MGGRDRQFEEYTAEGAIGSLSNRQWEFYARGAIGRGNNWQRE